jgi:phosphate uptake regulator
MKCLRAIEVISDHAGLISARASTEAVQDHLETCPTCAYWEQTMRAAIEVFGTAVDVEVPESLRNALENKIREREGEHV